MKKIVASLLILTLAFSAIHAQKVAVVDIEYILSKIPAYQQAQKELDQTAAGWQKEIEDKMKEVEQMYNQFQSEQVLLTETLKQQRIEKIESKEREIKELQRQRFGADGDLFKKRQELVKPTQDLVYNAIQNMATEKRYDIILDKSSGPYVLFLSPTYDKSDEIVSALGY